MIVANRYAQSLMELATEQKKVDAVRADMKLVEQVINENREFELFLDSPLIKKDKKLAILKAVFKGKINDLTLSFLSLTATKNRENILSEIAIAFEEQYKRDKNIFSAVVTTAKGLDATTRKKMLDLVKSQLNGEVELIEKINPATIGGFILTIDDKQVDRSVARQLNNLKKELLNKNLN